ncbi:MAG: POTRA domain-containing protein [Mucinivorans sp.]
MRNLILVLVVVLQSSLLSFAYVSDSTVAVETHQQDSVSMAKTADSLAIAQADKLKRLDFSQPARVYTIGKLSAVGLSSINPDLLISTTGLAVGDSVYIPGDVLSDAMRKLWEQRHFSNVKVSTDFRGDTVDVTFFLTERTRVRNWKFEGINAAETKELTDNKLKLRRSGELSQYQLTNTIDKIREFYYDKGFRNVDISYRIEPDTLSNQSNYVFVTFVVDRKKRVRIGEIKIEGAKNVSVKKIIKSMEKTKKVSINFFADTKFKDKDFPEDLNKITAYCRSKGYRDASIVDDSLYNISDKRIGVWIKINEGKKYYYRDISWIGNAKIPTEYLNLMLQLKKGDVYDSETMGSRLGSIQGKPGEQSVRTLYTDDGYLAFRVEPIETVAGDSVDVEIRIVEGKQFTIRNVIFDGNSRTNDHVIRRELSTRPGDLFSQTLLMQTYQRLAQMGQFDPTSFSTPDVRPDYSSETVDIAYMLKEVSNDKFELSGGWGGGMFVASVGVNFTNVSLRKFFDAKAWRPYPSGDNQTISIQVQSNGTYYQAASIGFTEPWLGGYKPTSLSVNFYTSRESNVSYLGKKATAYFGTIGGSVSVGKRLNWPDPYFVMSAGISMQTYNLYNWDYFKIRNGSSNTLALSLMIGRNSIDDPYQYSSRGSDISLSVSLTPPYSAWNGKNYADKKMSDNERYQWVEYHKWKFSAKWFFPLTKDNKLVLMARAQFGYLGYYNKDNPSPFEGFQMGGDGLTGYNLYGVETIGLRGYKNGSLTPYAQTGAGEYASIYSKYTAEIRYPVVRSEGTLVYVLAFAEAGNAYRRLDEFKPFNLKRSAGVGVRIFLPILGMLGVDWGWGFDPVAGDPKSSGSQLHFSLGMQM